MEWNPQSLRLACALLALASVGSGPAVSPVARFGRDGDLLPPGAVARLGSARFRHLAMGVLWLPGDRTLLSSGPGEFCVWDAATGRLLRSAPIPCRPDEGPFPLDCPYSVALSPDGRTLATGHSGSRVRLWNADTLKELPQSFGQARENEPRDVGPLSFTPDGRRLVALTSSSGIPPV